MTAARSVQVVGNLAVGDVIATDYGTGPYLVEHILADESGTVWLTLVIPNQRGERRGPYYLNDYRQAGDGRWRSCRGDHFRHVEAPLAWPRRAPVQLNLFNLGTEG